AAWRSLRGGAGAAFMAAGAALMAPALAIVLEVSWHPAATLGAYAWALHAMVIAAVMVVLANRFARRDGPNDRLRMSFAVLSALACIAFGMVILFSAAALTTALTVTVVTAAWLDRRFNLPLMGAYILVGVSAVGYRLVADPGLQWAIATTFPQMIFVYAGALAGFLVSWSLAVSSRRPRTEVLLESATFSTAGITLSLLFYRTVALAIGDNDVGSHWAVGIGASIWIILGLAQLRRLTMGGAFRRIRVGLGTLFLGIGAIQLGVGVVILNPVIGDFGGLVRGPILINSLIPAYLLPGVALLAGAVWLRDMPRMLRLGFAGVATGLVVLWAVLAIRHAWRGADLMATPGADQGELYTYTLAILIVGAMLFYQSLARRSAVLRKAGLAVIGLAVAKVFLVDIGELDGLTRVFSLLVLGFGLAGLAFLNRWAVGKDGGH
ncbi:MAG: DUF2339 domain-containing protein, partial [Alphaproteobacteria bacterium]|nr:DUF2339 domain-containing protein [Alphaproteobacteria bacterium]